MVKCLRSKCKCYPVLIGVFSLFGVVDPVNWRVPAETAPVSDTYSTTRMLCSALILPTIATVVGKLMFGNVHSNFQRTLLVRPQLFVKYISETCF